MEPVKPLDSRQVANIGKSVVIKGELSGSEDLYLDGEVEGNIELNGNSLTVGPNGRVRAHVNAREVVINGHMDGNISATERVELRKSAVLVGDIRTQRIMVEEGACFKGSIDVQREGKVETKREAATLEPAGAAVSQK